MAKYRGKKRIFDGKKMITVRDAAAIFGISEPACQGMINKGHDTIEKMTAYRKTIKTNKNTGGRAAIKHKTSEGIFTPQECANRHPFGLSVQTIRYRAEKWGWSHKSLWLEKKPPRQFAKIAIELDGPPRGNIGEDIKGVAEYSPSNPEQENIDRNKACYRNHFRERCVHYKKRLNLDDGHPEECLVASGSVCTNYEGEKIDTRHLENNSGAGVRHFGANGTNFVYH